MHPETKKYIRKRDKIANILMNEKIDYQYRIDRNDFYESTTKIYPYQAMPLAEKILAAFGMSKPKELYEDEDED